MDEVLKALLKYGLLPVLMAVVIFLLVQDPDRAQKLKTLILMPFFRLKKWFSKSYIEAEVAANVNQFLGKNIFPYSLSSEKHKIKINWITNSNDSVFKKNGKLILRLKEDDDQTKNILNATQAAIPNIVCPLIRSNIDYSTEKSIDLTLLKSLSEKLGRHGQFVFTKYFLKPETKEDATIGKKIEKLVELDTHGFFVPILLNELEMVGEELFAKSDLTDYSLKVESFIDYLSKIATREKGSENELNYLSSPFKVGTILLAIAHRADKSGVRPYLRRLRIKLEEGCESIYIVSFSPAFPFFKTLMKSLDGYERINVEKVIDTKDYAIEGKKIKKEFRIAVLSKNMVFSDESFKEKIQVNGINIGEKLLGSVQGVSEDEAQISIKGMRAYLRKEELDWFTFGNCKNKLTVGKDEYFYVKEIDFNSCTIFLTLNDPNDNPWDKEKLPTEGEIIEVIPQTLLGNNLLCSYKGCLEVKIPLNQISWFNKPRTEFIHLIGDKIKVKTTAVDKEVRLITASIKLMENNPWESIHQALPKGTTLNGKVIEITDNHVKIDLENDMVGILPSFCLKRAGHEYADYTRNMVLGQGIDVTVTKIFMGKKKITLDLKRNN